ncbi:YraN family protein [Microbacterium sp. CIAB417]|uniref:YraN family protein n=1 Tax=Microbacterium sp. CIAB417 TaxID=2860287 RepID=UPI001FAB426D|nr:YraN family protein [Microbacterium sp. CIAB417]
MAAKDDLGRDGESRAASFLTERGFRILDRNWRCPLGEIDIVALEAGEIVVVEVKTRTSERFGHPLEAIDARKRARLWRLAVAWCIAHPDEARGRAVRVDAVSVLGMDAGTGHVEHLRDVR